MPKDRYLIEAVAKGLDVLALFTCERDEVRLVDVMEELGLVKSTAFRLLYTLEKKGYIERVPDSRHYRRHRRRRLGLASISQSLSFVADVERGIETAARQYGLDLTIRRHEFDPRLAIIGVDELLSSGVELLIEYNPDEYISHIIADRCAQAKVPVIAITFPIPGAVLFGVNNYRVGLLGGEGLGEKISRQWKGAIENVAILDIPGRSPAQEARINGMLEGLLKSVAPPENGISHMHINRRGTTAELLMTGFLKQHPKARHTAVLCYNDSTALGALQAVNAAGRSGDVLILSQGGASEVRKEIRKARTPMWGAVAHFPERFGTQLVPMAQRMLRGEPTPNTVYTEAVLLTRSNINHYYPKE